LLWAAAGGGGGGAGPRADGSVLAEFDPDTITRRYGEPLVGLDRGALHRALLDAAGGELHLGSRLIDLDEDVLHFGDGSEERGELIVGADGLRSVVREHLLHDGEPTDAELVAFRGLSDWTGEVPAGEWWAERSIAGLLPLSGSVVYWYLAARVPSDGEVGVPADYLGEYGSPMGEVVRATPEAGVLTHRLYDRQPVQRWGEGVVTLLGDAAHPMLPFLGQGAGSALEDAVALGEAVSARHDIPAALRDYERRRVERTAGLVRGSRRAAGAALMGSGTGRKARNALMSRIPESLRLRQLDRTIGPAG
jgi:2-polyprenyl-6-methoxyphenol hydroxylase-like FAD-dependent oxidoreductase